MSADLQQGRQADRPLVLGLTGSIGMGKSATADMFRSAGIPVHDSDAAVHRLYGPDGAAARAIGETFPGTLAPDGSVDRGRLRALVLENPDKMKRLEALVHPLVQADRCAFLNVHVGKPLVVLDIPLLFETGAEAQCDVVLVVSAPEAVQRARVLSRRGMRESALEAILARQMPDAEKRRRANFVVDTSLGFAHAQNEVARIVGELTKARG